MFGFRKYQVEEVEVGRRKTGEREEGGGRERKEGPMGSTMIIMCLIQG